ncbi:haloalkane dehalogenase [Pseudoalteromonas luteoviolacea]|uniref:AB hydrolase-1 domain-containing protein n=1 Tax=Pseudoalteromonas luteoviolacea S4054 TaxID=1129367 RepID=A0A0F6AEG8_9GAMM|nr:haloalkane dehalogenase [Pseudoalteromonas luteoviolacea]AOT10345.1 hypothetical protein S4054249_20925 [Pseudoalteromonas luteoviolacea]AOT15586.1 hypothetical protein S40542_22665 [Pseudoalteromonas luteoviolacea]AOT20163.1 hypothetical protein S4054_20840 [Pseudoalteromonas luteoviolacea]KKE84607.1 hypothetical protein N479_08560 [Pseudoalteromonas luteoviolacea S4054]KZN71248.1 hypothetical protein N481_18860 [Pseudoalteromonas luteoviolacea S4047-1]
MVKWFFVVLLMYLSCTNVLQAYEASYKLPSPVIDETLQIDRKIVDVKRSFMSYLELGEGKAVVFVHGNPTSSYLWRNVMPYVAKSHRAVAVDLIGMGHSGKPDIEYNFKQQFRYFSRFIDELELDDIILVGHDWGAAIAWHYARKNPERVTALAFMEGALPPLMPAESFDALGPNMGPFFEAINDPVVGHQLVVEQNILIEQMLPSLVNRTLGEDAMSEYRAPYVDKLARKPLLAWPRQIPIAGSPRHTHRVMKGIERFMSKTDMPVLLLYASPGSITPNALIPWYVERIENIETAYVGIGLHYIQEDQPKSIGLALADWLRRLD